jgi:hypothetical protein
LQLIKQPKEEMAKKERNKEGKKEWKVRKNVHRGEKENRCPESVGVNPKLHAPTRWLQIFLHAIRAQ